MSDVTKKAIESFINMSNLDELNFFKQCIRKREKALTCTVPDNVIDLLITPLKDFCNLLTLTNIIYYEKLKEKRIPYVLDLVEMSREELKHILDIDTLNSIEQDLNKYGLQFGLNINENQKYQLYSYIIENNKRKVI